MSSLKYRIFFRIFKCYYFCLYHVNIFYGSTLTSRTSNISKSSLWTKIRLAIKLEIKVPEALSSVGSSPQHRTSQSIIFRSNFRVLLSTVKKNMRHQNQPGLPQGLSRTTGRSPPSHAKAGSGRTQSS